MFGYGVLAGVMASLVAFGLCLWAWVRFLEGADRRRQEDVHLLVASFRDGITNSVTQCAEAIGKAVSASLVPPDTGSGEGPVPRHVLEDVARSVLNQPDYSDPTDGWRGFEPPRVEAARLPANGDIGVPGFKFAVRNVDES